MKFAIRINATNEVLEEFETWEKANTKLLELSSFPPYTVVNLDSEKPKVKLIGEDGNIFSILARTRAALKEAGREEDAQKMMDRAFDCKSYEEALNIVMEYIEVE